MEDKCLELNDAIEKTAKSLRQQYRQDKKPRMMNLIFYIIKEKRKFKKRNDEDGQRKSLPLNNQIKKDVQNSNET